MNDEINYQNNPLHGLSLKNLLIEIVDHYGFEILFAYLGINCFKTNPSVDSSVKFLKKTDWAREKVEAFYLYQYKNLPRASARQFELPPRDRIVPEDQQPGEPATLSLEDAERLREKRAKKAAERDQRGGGRRPESSSPYGNKKNVYSNDRDSERPRKESRDSNSSSNDTAKSSSDPWAHWKK